MGDRFEDVCEFEIGEVLIIVKVFRKTLALENVTKHQDKFHMKLVELVRKH